MARIVRSDVVEAEGVTVGSGLGILRRRIHDNPVLSVLHILGDAQHVDVNAAERDAVGHCDGFTSAHAQRIVWICDAEVQHMRVLRPAGAASACAASLQESGRGAAAEFEFRRDTQTSLP